MWTGGNVLTTYCSTIFKAFSLGNSMYSIESNNLLLSSGNEKLAFISRTASSGTILPVEYNHNLEFYQ